MQLRKQSIRRVEEVTIDGNKTTKEELISLSENWAEKETIIFKKILAQGGTCRIQERTYRVDKPEPIRMVTQ